MYPGTPGYRPKPPSQETASTLTLIAWVIQLIISLVWIGIGTLFVLSGGVFLFLPAFGALVLLLGVLLILLPILMLYVGFSYSHARIRDGDFAGARAPTLLLGILGIPFGAVVVGILYIVAYVKIGDAESESRAMGGWPSAPLGSAPTYSYAPHAAGAPTLSGGVAYAPPGSPSNCPRCGRLATFIPQYGRSYCYSCAQYV
ncbi:MAG: hypothetical protein L3K18_06260 [Thermoplasmata archaeon]|nr:hypothetical protein [Thermoplasmata archaeon]MCI4356726.1 hypothetical protein [Thermoplasmata archaeon]